MTTRRAACALFGIALAVAPAARAEEASDEQLARELANPVANLISVPFQSNWERNIGPVDGGRQYRMNLQPVIPFTLSPEWNLITRVILPVVHQSDIFPGAGTQNGFGDTLASFFFSPSRPTAGGWLWGVGPVVLVPTGTNDLLTTDRWGLGPTGVALRQDGPWTIGALANHVWSVGGSSGRPDVNSSFLQPFMSYTTPSAWSFTLQAEATYDWERRDASIPVSALVGKVFRIGMLPVQVNVGPRYYATHFDNGPKGWGARLSITLVFPR
jgi:hypothetical protein